MSPLVVQIPRYQYKFGDMLPREISSSFGYNEQIVKREEKFLGYAVDIIIQMFGIKHFEMKDYHIELKRNQFFIAKQNLNLTIILILLNP